MAMAPMAWHVATMGRWRRCELQTRATFFSHCHCPTAALPALFLASLVRVGVRARGVEHGAAREAVARAGDDVAPRRAVAVARQVNLELGVAVTTVLEALARDAASGGSEQRRRGTMRPHQRLELVLAGRKRDGVELDVAPSGVGERRAVDADVGAEPVVGVHAEGVSSHHCNGDTYRVSETHSATNRKHSLSYC